MRLAGERLNDGSEIGHAILGWTGNPNSNADAVPLRLAGGLHRLVLSGGAPDLAAHYPPNTVSDDAIWSAVEDAMRDHAATLLAVLQSPPQTNEVRRSIALIPAFHLIAAETCLPLVLSELGASAGLNLLNDRFRLVAGDTGYGPPEATVALRPEWSGHTPTPLDVEIADRAGVDLRPIDLAEPAERLRLLSYLWADQSDRIVLTRAAMALAAERPPPVAQSDAIDWLNTRLPAQPDGTVHVVYHTIAWQYFPADLQARGAAMLNDAGSRATASRPLAHLSMEADAHAKGAALTLRIWPGGELRQLARVDFHGRWIDWIGST